MIQKVKFILIQIIQIFEIRIVMAAYKKFYMKHSMEEKNTKLVSKTPIIFFCVTDESIESVNMFIEYHLRIGADKIFICTLSYDLYVFYECHRNVEIIYYGKQIFDQRLYTNQDINNKILIKYPNCSIFILDVDEYLYSGETIYVDQINSESLYTYQINFIQNRFYRNYKKDIVYRNRSQRPSLALLNKPNKSSYLKYVDKKVFFMNKSISKVNLSKGNHKIFNTKSKISKSMFILHCPLLRKEKIRVKYAHEKNRSKTRLVNESIVSSLYDFETFSESRLWELNSYNKFTKNIIKDFSLASCFSRQ